jgi:hypothetical protein
MKIFDNVVSEQNSNQLEELLLCDNFPWFFVKKSSGKSKSVDGFSDTVQFEHHFVRDSQITSQAIHQVMYLMDWNNVVKETKVSPSIYRMKSNLLLKTQSSPNTPHIDSNDPHTVLLYYVNDSSGPTIFYDKNFNVVNEISPKRGRIVVFDGSIYHSSSPPQTNTHRCVINFNLKSEV